MLYTDENANPRHGRQGLPDGSTIRMIRPDDWHYHFRDDARLEVATRYVAKTFARAIAMPNLTSPVVTTDQALAYRERILERVPKGSNFEPLMTLYLTDQTNPEEIYKAKRSGKVVASKLYPAGATTNSASGVTDIDKILPVLRAMEDAGILLLVHGETTDPNVDIFDREKDFIDKVLKPLLPKVPKLKIVLEHITTEDAVDFVLNESSPNIAATITCHHLLYNRNVIFKGGINPHMYCLPILKREHHRQALLGAIKSGSKKFFLGTDSAPHLKQSKESSCGCAGIFSAAAALELYTEAFEEAGALSNLEAFCSFNGADFYGLPRNRDMITLVKKQWVMPQDILVGEKDLLIPLRAGQSIFWQIGAAK